MTDRNARNQRSTERRQAEGVRIIGAEEAQKALEAGQVAGRRSDDELRFGDVPPTPVGPRPPHRFPLPDSVDPADAVPLSPIAPLRGESPQATRLTRADEREPEVVAEAQPVAGDVDGSPPIPETATVAERTDWEAARPDPADPAWATPAHDTALRAGERMPPPVVDELDPTGPLPTQAGPGSEASAYDRLRWAAEVPSVPPVPAPYRDGAAADPDQAYRPVSAEGTGGTASRPSWDLGADRTPWEPAPYEAAVGDDGRSGDGEGWDTAATWGPISDADAEPRTGWVPAVTADPGYTSDPQEGAVGYGDAGAYEAPGYEAAGYETARGHDDQTGYVATGYDEPDFEDADYVDADADFDEVGSDPVGGYRTPRWHDEAPAPEVPDLAPPEEGITVTGSHVLPHWTEPSEGVPSSILGAARDESDSEAWNALGAGGARWRAGGDDWDDESGSATGFFADEDDQGPRLGALDTDRSDQSDIYSFDEAFQQLEEERSGAHPVISLDDDLDAAEREPVTVGVTRASAGRRVASIGSRVRARPTAPTVPAGPRRSPPGGQDLASRVGVGVGLVVLLIVAYAVGPKALLVLAAAVVLLCAAEAYGVLQRCGFRPATLLGLTATGGLVFASYWRGEPAVPLVVALAFAATMVWYLLGIVEARPLANVAVTSMTILWVGVLGSFAALMLRVPHGKGLFLGAVVVTVASDIVAYFVGRQIGHRPLAPDISPGKTVEGLIGGVVAAIVVGLIIGHEVTPWGGFGHGLLLGVAVAIFAPIGDLFESLIKRDLDVKDSGTTLAGHGGLLDRFDSLLLVLPAVYYVADYLHLVR